MSGADPAGPPALRVLIADDHPVFRDGLRLVLQSATGVELVGEATTGSEAVRAAAELEPDVVVMDLQMPGISGIEATRQILAARPDTAVVVLTMLDEDESIMSALQAGARGYLLKESSPDDIVRAVLSVARHQAVFGSTVAQRMVERAGRRLGSDVAFPHLTDREREVLDLIARGQNNHAIASALFLSGKTVRNHVSNILNKLHAADRAEAIVRAREAGLGRG
ncbi:MAG: response regulator [Acidimicrobiales bacterium]